MSRLLYGTALGLACGLVLSLHATPAHAAVFSTGGVRGSTPGGYVCADVKGGSLTPGTVIQAYACNAAPNQQFEITNYAINTVGGQRCMDTLGGSMAVGAEVISTKCNGAGSQQWEYITGQVIQIPSGLCVDSASQANGTPLALNTCNYPLNSQQWQIK